jgi:hypothetical protein
VAQALVPEGYFATQLAPALKLGQPQDDAAAENALSEAGIEPKNGWIADYPVTPAVLGEIEKSLWSAIDAGKLGINKEQALKAMAEIKIKTGLDATPVSAPTPRRAVIYKYTDKDGKVHYSNDLDTIPAEYKDKAVPVATPENSSQSTGENSAADNHYPANYDAQAVSQYYDSAGPPVITYYPPPSAYGYLYSWVPYTFWSAGGYYGGYYILRDFHRHVFFGARPWLLSNHFVGGNPGLPHGPAAPLPPPPASLQRFNSPEVQAGARAILNQNRFYATSPRPNPAFGGFAPRPGFSPQPSYGSRGFGFQPPPTSMARPAWENGFAPRGYAPAAPGFGNRAFQPMPAQHFFPAPRGFYPPPFARGPVFAPHFGGFQGGSGFGGHGGGHR